MARKSTPAAPAPASLPSELTGRFPITDISLSVLGGRLPAAAAVGELIPITATCFREGHDSLGVEVLLTRPDGTIAAVERMHSTGTGLDGWVGSIRPDSMGLWHFTIRAWGDVWGTWEHRADIKVPAGIDVDLELEEGALLLDAHAQTLSDKTSAKALQRTASTMRNADFAHADRLAAAHDPVIESIIAANPMREYPTDSGPWPLRVQRRRALYGSWYEFFPRSEGASTDPLRSGTFNEAAMRLPAIAAMGFDVIYVPPIHPIGHINRKGPNNTLNPGPLDPGCPWAIGSIDGGHDAVHPDLGTLADFDAFVKAMNDLGMEIALDLALQAAPDHPWVAAHPEWFTTRADGTIAYAENPPKKYQDIYPLNFDNDPEGLYAEVERVVRFWVERGVRIFRVDNPHTKPLWVWQRLIAAINDTDPDVLFLAEAFTRPPMMRALAEVGFQQSYTYFTWRTDKNGLESYGRELAGPASAYMRPNFFTNTPDILHESLQKGGPAMFAIRATLAATLSPTYGIYSGFELYEGTALREGSEEYLDSEKYQYRPRDWAAAAAAGRTLAPYLTDLNHWRREHPALQDLRSLTFHRTDNEMVLAYSKRDGDDVIAVVVTLDPFNDQSATITWDLEALGRTAPFTSHDLVTGQVWNWDATTYAELRPREHVAHIVHMR
jgi:starch synthase (maltosyl-transferring)